MSERLRGNRREEMQARVLAFLSENGPGAMSDIVFALAPVMSDGYVYRTVKELVADGRITARKARLTASIKHGERSHPVTYDATLYEVPRRRGRRRASS
jgi:hypothetical protein